MEKLLLQGLIFPVACWEPNTQQLPQKHQEPQNSNLNTSNYQTSPIMSEQKAKEIEMGASKTAEKTKKTASSGGHGDAYSGAISNRAIQKKKTIRMSNKPESGMNNIKSTALSPEKEKSGAFKMSS